MGDQFVIGFSIRQTEMLEPCSRVGFKDMLEDMLNEHVHYHYPVYPYG